MQAANQTGVAAADHLHSTSGSAERDFSIADLPGTVGLNSMPPVGAVSSSEELLPQTSNLRGPHSPLVEADLGRQGPASPASQRGTERSLLGAATSTAVEVVGVAEAAESVQSPLVELEGAAAEPVDQAEVLAVDMPSGNQ